MMKIEVNSGTLEGLKWLALVLMTLDHINKYLLDERYYWLFAAGRICMPLFCFVLAYKLAKHGEHCEAVYKRTMKRLFLYGLLASIPFHLLNGYWPTNILFMLLLCVLLIYAVEFKKRVWLVLPFVAIAGSSVEFWWWGIALTYFFWSYFKSGSIVYIVLGFLILASVYIINQNQYALLVFPVLYIATKIRLDIPRFKTAFYAYYPAHLAIIYAVEHINKGA